MPVFSGMPILEPRIMLVFHVYARTFALIFGHLCQFSSLCSRYGDISYCLPVLLSIILRSMHVQQYACLVFVVDHIRCLVPGIWLRSVYTTVLYILYRPFIKRSTRYILCSHFHNRQYSFETINHSSYYYAAAVLVFSCQLQSFLWRNNYQQTPPKRCTSSLLYFRRAAAAMRWLKHDACLSSMQARRIENTLSMKAEDGWIKAMFFATPHQWGINVS